MKIFFCTPIQKSLVQVKEGFNDKLFEFLTPWWMPAKLSRFDGCKVGDEVHLLVGPFQQKWISRITKEENNEQGWSFTDEGTILPWPLSRWSHEHRVDRPVFSSRPRSYVKFFTRNAP